jgi:hypothetical protein
MCQGIEKVVFTFLSCKRIPPIEILVLKRVCLCCSFKRFGQKTLVKSLLISTLDKVIYYIGTFLQGSTKPLLTSQNRVETSWKKFAHFFQHACSRSRFLWSHPHPALQEPLPYVLIKDYLAAYAQDLLVLALPICRSSEIISVKVLQQSHSLLAGWPDWARAIVNFFSSKMHTYNCGLLFSQK